MQIEKNLVSSAAKKFRRYNMCRAFRFVYILAITVVCMSATVLAQEAQPSMTQGEVAGLIKNTYDAPASKFLLKSTNGPDDRGFRVIFAYNGYRYTFDHNWWTDGIQIWVRPENTYHPDVKANALSDCDDDGVVDFGTNGNDKIFAIADYFNDGSRAKGTKHQPYWQGILNEAFAGLKATLE